MIWCAEHECPVKNCNKNPANMHHDGEPHSYAVYKGTADCPIPRSLDGCVEGCGHAKECFGKYDIPGTALRELMSRFCEYCALACVEED